MPEVVELDETDCDRLEAAADELGGLGLEIERFGPTSMLVRATPAALGKTDVSGLLADLAAELAELGSAFSPAGQARPCRRDHRLPRLGPGRAGPFGRRDERAAARDGSHAALRASATTAARPG